MLDKDLRKIFFYFEGGLGDIIIQYLTNKHVSALKEYRKLHWWTYAKVILNTHNKQAAELFRYHPEFDEIELHDYDATKRDEHQNNAKRDGFISWGGIDPVEPTQQINLGGHDRDYLTHVLPTKPYILYHPGAGRVENKLHLDIRLLCNCAKGLKIVLVGGNEPRPHLDGDQIINLIGIANPRLVCEIAKHAEGFIGSLSAYLWATILQTKVGCVCIKPKALENSYTEQARDLGAHVMNVETIKRNNKTYEDIIDRCLTARGKNVI